jgi:hypothetical protein
VRRLLILILVLLIIPAAFFAGAAWSIHRAHSQAQYELSAQIEKLEEIQRNIYGSNTFHWTSGYYRETTDRIDAYDPAISGGRIRVAYSGMLSESYLELAGTGELHAGRNGQEKLVTTIDPQRCREIFHRTLTCGILNYSDDVVGLKQDLIRGGGKSVTCVGPTRIDITVAELGVSKVIEILTPEIERENHPHIIEYKLVVDLQDEINGLVPAGFPLWK